MRWRRPKIGQQRLRGRVAAVDAIGNADAVVGVASQDQAWEATDERLDTGDALQMAEMVLRHGLRVATDAQVGGVGK